MLGHPETERADPHEEDVGRVWRDSGKIYGGRKIKHAPGHEGIVMSRRRVNRIMKAGGMAGSYSRARYRPHPARPNDDPALNLSARGFDGCKPRTHLAADPAYVRAGNSWAYICLPGDLANREIAGHSVGVRHDPDLVPVFCQVGVGRFGVSFSPCERRVSGRFGVGRSCWLLVIALVIA